MGERENPADLWPSSGACYLCGEVGTLCRSHIIPKFVGDWLRQTGVTGRLRSSQAPDRLVQDLAWRYMLCAKCEEQFSRFESDVCERIFRPLHGRTAERFRYGPSFARFAVSVVWRALVVLRREGRLQGFDQCPGCVDAAENTWRGFLSGHATTPAPHVVHALPLDIPSNLDTTGLSPSWGRFVLRTPVIGARYRGGSGYVIVKMARLIVFGVVVPGPERKDWKRTQLHVGEGAWGVDEWHVPGWFRHYLNNGARMIQEVDQGLSARQKRVSRARADEIVARDPGAIAASDAFRAFEKDLDLFGEVVFPANEDDEPV